MVLSGRCECPRSFKRILTGGRALMVSGQGSGLIFASMKVLPWAGGQTLPRSNPRLFAGMPKKEYESLLISPLGIGMNG